jgi:Tfp pilus assembly protein PilF
VDAASIDAVFSDGSRVPVVGIVKFDRIKDFAVLKLQEGFYSTLQIADSDQVKEFDATSALGFLAEDGMRGAGGKSGKVVQTYGFVLGIHPQAYPDFSYIYTTTPFSPGFSGGPVVDRENNVVGIATVEGRSINLALPINVVRPFFQDKQSITFDELRKRDRDSKEALYYRGNFALYARGDLEQATKIFKQVLAQDPNFILAYYDLAVAQRDSGQVDQAIQSYEKILSIHPDFPETLSNLGGFYFRNGQVEEAVQSFRRALEVYPNFIQARSNLGAVLNKLGRAAEAIPHLEKTLQLDPKFAIAHFNLGNSYFALGRLEEARIAYNQSVSLGVDFLSLHWKLYEVHHRLGSEQQAQDQLRVILEMDPENQEAREKLQE